MFAKKLAKVSSTSHLILLVLLVFANLPAFADEFFDDQPSNGEFAAQLPVDDVVINEGFINKSNWQEPIFAEMKVLRGIASVREQDPRPLSVETMGDLQVLPEIPFSYPWMTHRVLESRVLNKVEDKEKSRSTKSDS